MLVPRIAAGCISQHMEGSVQERALEKSLILKIPSPVLSQFLTQCHFSRVQKIDEALVRALQPCLIQFRYYYQDQVESKIPSADSVDEITEKLDALHIRDSRPLLANKVFAILDPRQYERPDWQTILKVIGIGSMLCISSVMGRLASDTKSPGQMVWMDLMICYALFRRL